LPQVHRNGDSRSCGASTTASNNSNVFVNNQPISVNGDPNTHGGGELSASCNKVYVGEILVVLNGNSAAPDSLCPLPGGAHCGPSATSGSPDVEIGA
jgi:uncharacterized Zn-binding protein involved in type VI secretion